MSTRNEILKAADALFGKDGFDATSIRDIAELSGINKGLVHYHFKNKEDLLLNVLDQYYQELFQKLQAALYQKGNIKERISSLITTYFDFLSDNHNFSKIVQKEASGGKNVERIRKHMLPFFKMGTMFIQNTYPNSKSGTLAAEQILISFYGMIVTYFSFSDILEPLITEPLSEKNLENRKLHLKRMLDLLIDALEKENEI